MKRLFLLRHAKAEAAEPGQDDRDRPLSPRGVADAEGMGRYLSAAPPGRMLVSASRRTIETAGLLGLTSGSETREALYLARPGQILALIQAADDAVTSLMVIGHNPGLEELAGLLARKSLRRRKVPHEKFPTCAMAVLDFKAARWRDLAPGEGTLVDFVCPETL